MGHVGPEAALGGPIGLLRNGDVIDIDAKKGTINVRLTKSQLAARRKNGNLKNQILVQEHYGNMLKLLDLLIWGHQHTLVKEKKLKNIQKFNED